MKRKQGERRKAGRKEEIKVRGVKRGSKQAKVTQGSVDTRRTKRKQGEREEERKEEK